MELTIFDRDLNEIGMIEKFQSLLWNRRFKRCGDFTITCSLNEENLMLLKKENIIMLRDREEVGVILYQSFHVSEDGVETLQIKGKLSKSLLSRRIIWGTKNLNGYADNCLKTIIRENCTIPTNKTRVIPNLLCDANIDIGKRLDYQVSYKNVMDECENICDIGDIGYGVVFDRVKRKFTLKTYKHIDRSVNQNNNSHIVFSQKFDNVATQTFTDSLIDYKNLVLVGGIGEGVERKLLIVGGETSGLDRFEVFNDQRSLTDKDDDGNPIPEVNYQLLMKEKGNITISEHRHAKSFVFKNVNQANVRYLIDYDLGDIVTCIDDSWGTMINTPINEIQEIYENGRVEVSLIVGDETPTVLNKIKKGMI